MKPVEDQVKEALLELKPQLEAGERIVCTISTKCGCHQGYKPASERSHKCRICNDSGFVRDVITIFGE